MADAIFLPLVARWEVYRMPQPRKAATTINADFIYMIINIVNRLICANHDNLRHLRAFLEKPLLPQTLPEIRRRHTKLFTKQLVEIFVGRESRLYGDLLDG